MAKISTYTVVAPKAKDKIIISESDGTPSNVTKNVTVDGLKTFINDVPVPTLQEVTTSGNTTTKNITTQGIKSEGTRSENLIVKVGDYDGSSTSTKLEVDVAAKTVSVDANILKLNKLGGTNTDITFNPTASRSIAMPDASGTIALTSDLPSASPWNPDTNGINYQAGNVGIGTASGGDALTVNGQISSTAIETGGMLVEGNATIDDALSAETVTATTLTGNLVGTVDTTTTGVTQPSTTDNNLLATTAFVQDLLGDVVSEWVGQISQSSTSAPVIARTQTSTLFVGDRVTTPTAFRYITFSRNAVGTYRLAVNWTQSTVPTDANKLSIMFGDNVARVYTFTLGSINGVNYKEFLFRTYTPAGVEADDQLLGINGAMTSVILYP